MILFVMRGKKILNITALTGIAVLLVFWAVPSIDVFAVGQGSGSSDCSVTRGGSGSGSGSGGASGGSGGGSGGRP